jgi:hypothetical protein
MSGDELRLDLVVSGIMKALGNGGEERIFPVTGAVDVNAFGGLINQ